MIGKNEPQLFPWKIKNNTAALHISVYIRSGHELMLGVTAPQMATYAYYMSCTHYI